MADSLMQWRTLPSDRGHSSDFLARVLKAESSITPVLAAAMETTGAVALLTGARCRPMLITFMRKCLALIDGDSVNKTTGFPVVTGAGISCTYDYLGE